MSINSRHFREFIVRPALKPVTLDIQIEGKVRTMNLWSLSAEELCMMTAAQETHLGEYLRQGWKELDDGRGVGLGVYSMEPATHADVWRYVSQRNIRGLPWAWQQEDTALIWNLKYATVMARMRYLPARPNLPAADDLPALAAYWNLFYNRNPNAGTAEEALSNYAEYVN